MIGLLFTYAVTFGGAIGSLFNPFVGLIAYIGLGVLKPEAVWPWSVSPGNYSRFVALAMLAGWVIHRFGDWNLGRARAVVLALVGYLAWAVLSGLQAPQRDVAFEFVDSAVKIVLPIVVGISTIRSVQQLKILAWVILLCQAFPAYELNMSYFGGYNQLKEDGFAGFDNNSYAISLVACSGLAGFLTLYSDRWWEKAVAAAAGAFLVHAVLISFSRGAMLGLAVVGLVSFWVSPKKPKELLAFGLAVVLIASFTGPQVLERFQSSFQEEGERDESAESRLLFWGRCWEVMLERPVFGLGPDHIPFELSRLGHVVYEGGVLTNREAHTLWLQLGAELGFPGVLALIAYYGLCVVRLMPIAKGKVEVADPWLAILARAVIPSLCGFAVSAQFVSLERLETPYYIALLGAGVLKLSTRKPAPINRLSMPQSTTMYVVGVPRAGIPRV